MKRILVGGLAAVLVVGGFLGGRAVFRSLAFFSVRRVELAGARYVSAPEVAAALGITEAGGASVFDDTGPWLERVKALPGVLEARIRRRLPGTLRVTIREAEPVALGERGNRLVLLNAAGQVLPFDPTRPASDLPLAPPDSVVAQVLARIQEADPAFFAQIQRGRRVARDVALELERGQVLVRGDAGPEAVAAVTLVSELLEREGRSWRELDARFLPRIVVRGGGPQPFTRAGT